MAKNRKILLSLAALGLLAAATVLPISLASAAPQKIYDLNIAPTSLAADTAGQTLTATFTNATPSGNSTINSLKLFAAAPAGFQITAASGVGTETVQPGGQSVWVSNIPSVKPGKSYVLTLTVTTPAATDCGGAHIDWTADVRAGNSFTGDTFAPNTVTGTPTSIAVECSLSFTTQPSDALKNVAISPAIVVHGTPAALFAGGDVTLAVDPDSPTQGTLSGTATRTADSNGDATFDDISLSPAGTYTLVATSGGSSVTSAEFTISDGVLDCNEPTPNVGGVVVTRLDNADPDEPCELIDYILTFDGTTLTFLKDLSQQQSAQFIIEVDAWDPEPAQNPVPATQVDTPSPLHDLQWCGGTLVDPTLPGSEVTCLMKQSTEIVGNGDMQVSETIYLFGDILYKR